VISTDGSMMKAGDWSTKRYFSASSSTRTVAAPSLTLWLWNRRLSWSF